MKRYCIIFAALAVTLGASGESRAASLVLNGGLETGDFTGWSSQGWLTSYLDGASGKVPGEGTFFAQTGCVGDLCINGTTDEQAYLFQDIATVAGEQYTLSFDFSAAGDSMELKVLFDGTTAFDLSGLGFESGYTSYSTTVTASGTTARLEFLGRQDPGFNALDNIALEDAGPGSGTGAAPEPSAWLLGLSGVVAAGCFRRR